MSGVLEYKGYIGPVEFDADAGIFHGEVSGMRDVITFQGKSVEELRQAFRDSVDDYLAFCAERNEEPDKSFSGQFVTRVDPEVHRLATQAAAVSGVSLNAWVANQLRTAAEVALGMVGRQKKMAPRSGVPGKATRKRPARKKSEQPS